MAPPIEHGTGDKIAPRGADLRRFNTDGKMEVGGNDEFASWLGRHNGGLVKYMDAMETCGLADKQTMRDAKKADIRKMLRSKRFLDKCPDGEPPPDAYAKLILDLPKELGGAPDAFGGCVCT